MSNNTTPTEVTNAIVCEAIGCYSKATNTIALSVGPKRTISLLLCSKCRSKLLRDTANREISQHRDHIGKEDDNL